MLNISETDKKHDLIEFFIYVIWVLSILIEKYFLVKTIKYLYDKSGYEGNLYIFLSIFMRIILHLNTLDNKISKKHPNAVPAFHK
ncbi:hypothetical protein HZS_7935 [Henneguya salminicola]|nr:hypothetical protein HZS_7935 [Henneguya salminicola]